MVADLLLTDFESLLLLGPIGGLLLHIPLVRNADHRLQGLDHLVVRYLHDSRHHRAELDSPGRLHDHVVTLLYLKSQRIEKINLARCPKPYSDYLNHLSTSL